MNPAAIGGALQLAQILRRLINAIALKKREKKCKKIVLIGFVVDGGIVYHLLSFSSFFTLR